MRLFRPGGNFVYIAYKANYSDSYSFRISHAVPM